MMIEDTAKVLAKVQLGDNREVSKLLILEWHDTFGELLTYEQAIAAVTRFRRERPDDYMNAGHVLQMADVEVEQVLPVRDLDPEWLLETKQRALAEFGYTVEQYDIDPKVRADVVARWATREIASTDG